MAEKYERIYHEMISIETSANRFQGNPFGVLSARLRVT